MVTPIEFNLLLIFMRSPGRVFTRTDLVDLLTDSTFTGLDSTLNVHIRHLRLKIEPDPSKPQYIETCSAWVTASKRNLMFETCIGTDAGLYPGGICHYRPDCGFHPHHQRRRLTQLIIDQQVSSLQASLSTYYTSNGSWNGVAQSWPQMRSAPFQPCSPNPSDPGNHQPVIWTSGAGLAWRMPRGLWSFPWIRIFRLDPASL